MAVKCTVLKTLFAEIRRSSARDSLTWIVLLSDMFIDTCPGPSIIFRPASPKLEPFALAQVVLGAQNAAVLNHLSVVGSLTEIDCPATAFRSEEHTSELQSRSDLVCRLLLEKKKKKAVNSKMIHIKLKNIGQY